MSLEQLAAKYFNDRREDDKKGIKKLAISDKVTWNQACKNWSKYTDLRRFTFRVFDVKVDGNLILRFLKSF
jgi:hypothetical protein